MNSWSNQENLRSSKSMLTDSSAHGRSFFHSIVGIFEGTIKLIDVLFQTHSSFIRLHSTYLCYGFFLFVEFLPVYSCSHLSTVLGNKFDHGAEAIVPVLFNLIPNCAKVMATSGVSAIRIIIRVSFANTHINSCRHSGWDSLKSVYLTSFPFASFRLGCVVSSLQHTHVPRLIPLITSNCTSKSVAVRRWE